MSALPLAWFRALFGACLALDVGGLIRRAPLWFDEVPFVEPTGVPVVPLLSVWFVAAVGLMLGAFTRACAVVNYVACVGFLGVAAMPLGFEYHLDNLYLIASLGLIFLPVSRRFSIDAWRRPPALRTVGRLPEVFLALIVASIYLDSSIWKLSSRLWIEGLGYWTPATHPWDALVSLPWTIENELFARFAGYLTFAYELSFVAFVWSRRLRLPLLAVGFVLHLGIGTVIPLPLFGLLMIAFLVGLIPLRAPQGEEAEERPLTPLRRRTLATFYAGWAAAFGLSVTEPIGALAQNGIGGLTGAAARPWHVTDRGLLARAYGATTTWSYRLFGFRTHAIFLDSQFTGTTVQTRLLHVPAGGGPGERFHGPLRNRQWLAWHYRMVWPELPRERAEASLVRFVTFHAVRADLDLEAGRVLVEQRPIEMPVDGWRPGQRARNLASPWRTVGVIRGAPGALEVRWEDPVWVP